MGNIIEKKSLTNVQKQYKNKERILGATAFVIAKLSDNYLGDQERKVQCAIAILENKQLDSTLIISHFGCTNIIFAVECHSITRFSIPCQK